MAVVELECSDCLALVDHNLVGACASVGIEHGKTTAQMLHEYLNGVHEREGHA